MSPEKISIIITVLLIAAGILSHSVLLDNGLSNLSEDYKQANSDIKDLTKNLIELRTSQNNLEKYIEDNKYSLSLLNDEIRKSNLEIKNSAIETRNLLLELQRE